MKILKEKIKIHLRVTNTDSFTPRKLMHSMGLKSGAKKKFEAALFSLVREGYLLRSGGLFLVRGGGKKTIPAVIDRLQSTFGFAKDENGEDFFIAGSNLKGAVTGDRVLITQSTDEDGRKCAKVIKITEYTDRSFSGRLIKYHNRFFFYSSSLGKEEFPIKIDGGEDGDIVLAKIISRDGRSLKLSAVKNFGAISSAAESAELYLKEKAFRLNFPQNVLDEAKALSVLPIEKVGRKDLTALPLFTIDSEYSKDLDDAICVEKTNDGYRLYVSIADVSHYVTENSALDNESFSRGTSVYFADKVIPMLPKELSNGICSLNPNEDRFSLTCEALLSQEGEIVSFEFYKSVIRSRVKGVYKEINSIFDGKKDAAIKEKYAEVSGQFSAMLSLYEKLKDAREKRHVIDFETPESQFLIDDSGKAIGITNRKRGLSERIIEEFMITANQCAALFSEMHKLPFIYRIHEKPSPEKAEELKAFLLSIGASVSPSADLTSNASLYNVLEGLDNSEIKFIADKQVLRSMAKARYSETNKGHFGLALSHYSHFTSPIRRYPDLIVHRIISKYLEKGSPEKKYIGFVEEAAAESSLREQAATIAERDIDDRYKAEYASMHIGEEFEGIISGVTATGFFVLLDNTLEGFVSVKDKGTFELSEGIRLSNKQTGVSYKIGDKIKITIKSADIFSGKTDFVEIEN